MTSGLKAGLRYRREGRVPILSPEHPRPEFLPLTMDPLPRPPRRRQTPVASPGACSAASSAVRPLAASASTRPIWPRPLPRAGTTSPSSVRESARAGSSRRATGSSTCRWSGIPFVSGTCFLWPCTARPTAANSTWSSRPLWSGNGAAVGSAARWPLVVRLETPFALIREMSGIEYNHGVKTLIAAEQLQLAYATGIIGISQAVVSTVESTYHVPLSYHGRRLTVIPLGLPSVDRIPFRQIETPASEGTRFLYIGRFEARKGVLELGEAFARVARQDPKATLWLVGADNSANDGFAARTGKSYIQALYDLWGEDIGKRVHYLRQAWTTRSKNYLLSACDILVAPSLYESFGLMYVEAMRAGKPVIGSNAGGIPEVVDDGGTGLLVPPGDVPALTEAMLRLGADADLRQTFGHNGLQRFEQRFSLYNFGRQTENFYREVLDEWRGRKSGVNLPTASPGWLQNPINRPRFVLSEDRALLARQPA